jgi:S-adenosylmethionine:tRNA ribosyltransferase-isomerase
VVALGTTVARALESAARSGGVRAGAGLATLRLGPSTPLLVTDVLVTGVHERGTSHHALLHAFADAAVIERATARMEREGFRHHEFGDAMWLERRLRAADAA